MSTREIADATAIKFNEALRNSCSDLSVGHRRLLATMINSALQQAIADEREAKWQRIESAPRTVEWQGDGHGYGPYILAWPVFGTVARVRWWQSKVGGQGWIEDGGNAVNPTIWQSLPAPPALRRDSSGEESRQTIFTTSNADCV